MHACAAFRYLAIPFVSRYNGKLFGIVFNENNCSTSYFFFAFLPLLSVERIRSEVGISLDAEASRA